MSNLYSMYNEALTAKSAVDNLQHVAELAAESLRLTSCAIRRANRRPSKSSTRRTRSSRRATRPTMPRRGIAWRWRICRP